MKLVVKLEQVRPRDSELSEDERSTREVFGNFFTKELPIERVRATEAGGFDAELWQGACAGIPLMGTPEEQGGGGATMVELALVAMERGRRLARAPLAEAVVAARPLARTEAGKAPSSATWRRHFGWPWSARSTAERPG